MSAHISFEGEFHAATLSDMETNKRYFQKSSAFVFLEDANMNRLQLCLRTPEQGRKIAQEIMRAMDKLEEVISHE